MIFFSEPFNQVAGVDVYRACCCAKTVNSTCVQPVVLILIEQQFIVSTFARFSKAFQSPPDHYPTSGSSGDVAAGTLMFTITALNTAIYFCFNRRQVFEIMDMNLMVIVNDHPGVQ